MRISAIALSTICLLSTNAAYADGQKGDIVVAVGQFSALRSSQYSSTMGNIEYRFPDQYHGLRPTVGAMANTDGATYGYAGINWDLPISAIRPFVITPGVKVGAYSQGSSKDLGYGVEFHDSIEVTYRFNDGQRVGASLAHMSNASLGNSNPGVETIQAVYSIPF